MRRLARRLVLWAVPELALVIREREKQVKLSRELREHLFGDVLREPPRPGTIMFDAFQARAAARAAEERTASPSRSTRSSA